MDNSSFHTAKSTKQFIAARSISITKHLLYSLNLVQEGYFLFPMVKDGMRDICIVSKMVKKGLVGVWYIIPKDIFTKLYRKWVNPYNLCIKRVGDWVKK
jgi:hypothetical protein